MDYLFQIFGQNYEAIEAHLIIVLTTTEHDSLRHSTAAILGVGMTSYIVIYEEQSWKIFSANVFGKYKTVVELSESVPKFSEHFPDNQRNLEGYTYQIVLVEQYPKIRSTVASGALKPEGVNIEIFSEIAKHQGGSWKVDFKCEDKNGSKTLCSDVEKFVSVLFAGDTALTLNTAILVPSFSYRSMINTYDVVAFCAVVPVPPRLSFLRFLLTPYDTPSWLALGLAVSVSAWIWRFLIKNQGNSNSASHFMFGIFGNFLGQAIPFRTTSRMQTTLLYLCILMTFILGSAYQSIILSLMSKSREGERFTTFEELFQSNMSFDTDQTFKQYLQGSQSPISMNRFNTDWTRPDDIDTWNVSKKAAILRCDSLEFE